MQKQLYIDLDRNLAVNPSGNQLASRPVLILGEQPDYRITFGRMIADNTGESVFTPEDLSGVASWRLSVDRDFARSSVPMCRSVMTDGIDISGAANGVIVVPVDTQTESFFAAVDGKEHLNCFLQLTGWDNAGRQTVFVRLPWSAWGNIDYDGATAVVPQDTLSGSALRAVLAAGMVFQYSATGGNDAGHNVQTASDRFWRMRANGLENAAWSDWIAMVAGPQGPQGATGAAGAAGADGRDGADGASAYQIAVANGFSGTETEWLASLRGSTGAAGTNGAAGADGQDGSDGASAYEIAVAHGFSGTEVVWLASLKGADGADGADGQDGQDCSAATLSLVRPASDLALFPVIQASANADFANATTLDARSSSTDRAYCKVFTGTQWIDLPADGLGTPFDGLTVAVDMSTKFAGLTQPYFVRYCWRSAAGADSDWESLIFPSVGGAGGGPAVANPVSGDIAGLKIARLTAAQYAALTVPDANTLYLIVG